MDYASFSDNIWVLLFVFILAAFVGYKMYEFVIKEVEKRNKISVQLIKSQLTALRAQMNPHFMFNALNSIQEFIITSDTKGANKYLSNFSKLTRKVLNNSDKESISLSEEIETLELYLSLEQLRFEDDFEYLIEVEPGIDPDIQIVPPMLIQPFVENAIKHGLLHRKGQKKLGIWFKDSGKDLLCIVQDNGIGRAASTEIQKRNRRGHISKGVSVTKERIDLLNRAHGVYFRVKINDLQKDLNAIGTEVEIKVSHKFNPQVDNIQDVAQSS